MTAQPGALQGPPGFSVLIIPPADPITKGVYLLHAAAASPRPHCPPCAFSMFNTGFVFYLKFYPLKHLVVSSSLARCISVFPTFASFAQFNLKQVSKLITWRPRALPLPPTPPPTAHLQVCARKPCVLSAPCLAACPQP